jgi:hypothetical protein
MWYSRHKYGAERTELNGRSYPSKKQARHAQELELAKRAGELVFYLEEVPIRLPGCVHRIDFVEFWADGEIRWVEVKGFDTPVGKLKRKQVEALYPFKITVI